MNLLKQWAWLIIVTLLLAGISINLFQSQIGAVPKVVQTFDGAGQVVKSLSNSYPWYHLLLDILAKLFYAVATSVFVAVLITRRINDSLQAQHKAEIQALRDAVNKDVFDALFHNLMDETIFAVVKSQLIQKEVIVRGAKWHYEFFYPEKPKGNLSSSLTIRYSLHNISKRPVTELITMTSMDGPDAKEKLAKAICMRKGELLINYDVATGAIPENVTVVDEFDGNPFMQMVTITIDIPAESSVDLTLVIEGSHRGNVTDAYFTKYPIVDGSIIFQYPKEYNFGWAPSISADVKLEIDQPNKKTFEVTGAILPKQGFVFFLRKK